MQIQDQGQDQDIHLRDYWRALLKRRHVAITFFAAVVGIVTVYSFAATPAYQATVQILLESDRNATMTFVEGATVVTKDPTEIINTQMEILNSRAFIDRVIRKMQLDKNPYFLKKKDMAKNSLFASMSRIMKDTLTGLFPAKSPPPVIQFPHAKTEQELDQDITDIILESMKVNIIRKSSILKINYLSENPIVAASMANGIANIYIEHNLDIRVRPYKDAAEWLSTKMLESRSRVEASEKELQQYKENKGIVSFELKENVITQKLGELVSQSVQAENKRQEAEIRYNQIKSVIDNPELLATVPDIMNNLVIQGLRNEELRIKKDISELSQKYGPKHPQMIKAKSELESVQKNLIAEARKMLNAAKTEYEIAKSREASLKKTMEEQKQEVLDLSKKAIEFNVVAGEAQSNKQFYELLLKRMQEASLSSGMTISNIQIVDSATIPKHPIKPRRGLNILLALITGLLGGIGMAFFVEFMDDTVKTPEDVNQILGLPFLGFVPSANKNEYLHIIKDPKSGIAESYRTIRTGVMLSSAEKPPQIILVTSSTPNEGKTLTASNLAIAMAHMGEKVLLIDGDLRRHNLHKVFNLDNSVGISDVIVNHDSLSAAVKPVPDIPNLYVITGGTEAPNPSELLGSNRMKELMTGLRQGYDRIIIDSPPLMIFSDALVLSRLADGTILIVWGGKTGRDVVRNGGQSLATTNAKMLGVVLNNVKVTKRNSYYYYSYHNYYYGKKGAQKE